MIHAPFVEKGEDAWMNLKSKVLVRVEGEGWKRGDNTVAEESSLNVVLTSDVCC